MSLRDLDQCFLSQLLVLGAILAWVLFIMYVAIYDSEPGESVLECCFSESSLNLHFLPSAMQLRFPANT